jgi:hypothetical protein
LRRLTGLGGKKVAMRRARSLCLIANSVGRKYSSNSLSRKLWMDRVGRWVKSASDCIRTMLTTVSIGGMYDFTQ